MYFQTIAVASAYVQSIARLYPVGVSLVAGKREDLLSVSVQNRDTQPIYFWHGTAYESLAAQAAGTPLPLDPTTWTEGQRNNFAAFVEQYGERVNAQESLTPQVSQKLQLYSVVPSGTARAHVKVGLPQDPMTTLT
jgi:hypothetical protein